MKKLVGALAGAIVLLMFIGLTDEEPSRSVSTTETSPKATEAEKAARQARRDRATKEAAALASNPTPIGCLEDAAGLKAEKRDSNSWRGTETDRPAPFVRVLKFNSRDEAAQAVAEADLVYGVQGGRYAVFGGSSVDDTTNVLVVARCLEG